jgi:hypothetical protein
MCIKQRISVLTRKCNMSDLIKNQLEIIWPVTKNNDGTPFAQYEIYLYLFHALVLRNLWNNYTTYTVPKKLNTVQYLHTYSYSGWALFCLFCFFLTVRTTLAKFSQSDSNLIKRALDSLYLTSDKMAQKKTREAWSVKRTEDGSQRDCRDRLHGGR